MNPRRLVDRLALNAILSAALIALSAISSAPAAAQIPTTRLDTVAPAGGKIGSEVEIKLSGGGLEEADRILFSHEGITGSPKISEKSELSEPMPVPGEFIVKIADNVPPGIYELRVTGRYGMSNPRAFAVGKLEEATESDNNSRDKAQELAIGTTVNGTVAQDTVDYYKFTATAGQRILIDCAGQRIDSRIDATLVLYDPSGKEIRRVRDTDRRDPLIDLIAPEAGDYVVGVYDFTYGGGSSYVYRLSLHSGPHVSFVFPPVGQPGSNTKYTLYGHNLPGAKGVEGMAVDNNPVEEMTVDISMPAEEGRQTSLEVATVVEPYRSSIDGMIYRLDTPQGATNPVTIGYATAPVAVEVEPNDKPAEAQKVNVPCEYVGQFYPSRDSDWVAFDAKKGEEYWIEVISHRLGASTDPHLRIEKVTKDSEGKEKVSSVATADDIGTPSNTNAFDTSTSDAAYRLKVDEDATYRVQVSNLFGNAKNDPRLVYRLVIRPPQPDFRLMASPVTGADPKNKNKMSAGSTVLIRGGTQAVNVWIHRLEGFDGEVGITADGLPQGVTCHPAAVGGESNSASLLFSADENAAAASGPIRIFGKAKINDQDVTREARSSALVWGTDNPQQQAPSARLTRNISLSVTDAMTAPVSVQLGDGNVIETSRGAKVEIPVKATKRGEIKGDIKMSASGAPKDVKPKELNIKGNDAKLLLELTNNNVKPGTYTVYLRGTAKFKYTPDPERVKRAEAKFKRFDEMIKPLTEKSNAAKAEAGKNKDNKELAEKAQKAERLLKEAQRLRGEAEKRFKDLQNSSKPKDADYQIVSTPVSIRVAAAPITLTASPAGAVKQGDKLEIPVKIERKYGFEDAVEISLKTPDGVKGISAGKIKIEKGQTEGKLELTAAADATDGTHSVEIQATLKFNNVNIASKEEVTLNVEKVNQPASN